MCIRSHTAPHVHHLLGAFLCLPLHLFNLKYSRFEHFIDDGQRIFLSLSKLGCGVNESLFHARWSDCGDGAKRCEEEKQREAGGVVCDSSSPPSLSPYLFFFPAL